MMVTLAKILSLIFSILILSISSVSSKQIYVKYRGPVDTNNGHLSQISLKSSSLVQEIFYDADNHYLIVNLNGTYYHYCELPEEIVKQ